MTFSLQQFKAYGIRTSGATRQHVWQVAELGIVAANTDVALDISSDTAGSLGTFWTAAVADTTYGTLATNSLTVIRNIATMASSLKGVDSDVLMTKSKLVTSSYVQLLSAASVGGSPTESYTVTGLLSSDTIVAVTPNTITGNLTPQIVSFLSAAITSSATPTATVTGLLGTDTILSVTQAVANANSLTPIAYGSPASNALPLTYSGACGANGKVQVTASRQPTSSGEIPIVAYGTPTANTLPVTYQFDPGTGAKVEVLVQRTGTETATTGTYTLAITGKLPNIAFASGDAPTSHKLRLIWTMQDTYEPFVADYGAAF